jgi:hypothetical protein
MQVTPHTVEFDVALTDGTRVGSMVTWALPAHGDRVRVDEPGKQPLYEVLHCLFEPSNITVVVQPAGSAPSAFAQQQPGVGGFA